MQLEKTGHVSVYTTEANNQCCRFLLNSTARELTKYLLDKYSVLIKDLTGKKGIPDNSFIRLAIRDQTDNDLLIQKLESFRDQI
ncbi:MAG: hypothetical protein LBE13_15835 [Bacteroidales bacterium]|jgi:histidinol-phosphate/aromatic aminotransferase/cobyric acid decarboxylase-like protein|nr:hypothetical protein [Bacteroidales bacterium]